MVKYDRTKPKKLKSMLSVDCLRLFASPLLYVLIGVSFSLPVLILVMTTLNGGEESTLIFTSVWQSISSVSEEGATAMDITSMMNINILFFLTSVLVGIFVSEEFKSGYAKNIFAIRHKKGEYVLSKILLLSFSGALTFIAYFLGAIVGGKIAELSFELTDTSVTGLIFCMLSKIALIPLFSSIDLLISVFAKQKTWLSILGSLALSALLFPTIPMMTPLNSGIINLFLCLAGGIIFAFCGGLGCKFILDHTDIV